MDNPCLENQPQLNKDKRNTNSSSTKEIKSYPNQTPQVPIGPYRTGCGIERTIENSF